MKQNNWQSYIKDLPDFPLFTSPWEKEFVKAVFKNISKQGIDRVLEVGCSNGRWLRWFNKEYGAEVYGIDNNPAGFKKNDIVNFQLGDAGNLPYQDDFFDLVFSMGLVEHFRKPDKFQILKEQARVLKKDGYLICQAPRLDLSLNYLYMKYTYDFRKGTKHFRTTKKELENYLRKTNLKILSSQYTGRLDYSIPIIPKRFFSTEILIISRK